MWLNTGFPLSASRAVPLPQFRGLMPPLPLHWAGPSQPRSHWFVARRPCLPQGVLRPSTASTAIWSARVSRAGTVSRLFRLVRTLEKLLTFEGKPLFPERRAYTVTYPLSDSEALLYKRVTDYVREEMNRADRLKDEGEGSRGAIVGFALTTLQRRLASSPEAIYQSLRRRRQRLEKRAGELRIGRRRARLEVLDQSRAPAGFRDLGDGFDEDDLPEGELEDLETELVDEASAALAMTASFGPTMTPSFGPTQGSEDALNWTHLAFLAATSWPTLPAAQGRTSSLRCGRSTLTCGSSSAIGQQSRKATLQAASRRLLGVGPFQADIEGVRFEVGPLQAVRVGPLGGVVTTARTIAELELEIATLADLENLAAELRSRGEDRKWGELSALVRHTPEMFDAAGKRRKLIIFSEHRDTLNYLAGKLRALFGSDDSVVTITRRNAPGRAPQGSGGLHPGSGRARARRHRVRRFSVWT